VHPKQLFNFTKQKVYVRWISATSSRYQLSRIPHVHYSSHKSPATEPYLEPHKSRPQPNTIFFLSLRSGSYSSSFSRESRCPAKFFGMPNVPGFFKPQKYDLSDNVYEHFDFPTVEPNIYSSSTTISWTVTGGNRRGRGRRVGWWL
jgi:hypothetical protein